LAEANHQTKALFAGAQAAITDRFVELELEQEARQAALQNEALLRMDDSVEDADQDEPEEEGASSSARNTLGLLARFVIFLSVVALPQCCLW
jgi:hypothetical protein